MKDITSRAATFFTAGHRRYTATARALHWITTLLIFVIVPLGWVLGEFKKPPGGVAIWASLHKSLGLIVLALVIARLAWRAANPPPPLPPRMADWEKVVSIISHWLLYAVFLSMPISGYIMSSGGDHPISFLGLFDVPKLAVGHDVMNAAGAIHLLGQFAVYALVLLHISATAWHLAVRRDGILDRMLPRQINAE
jgi:cytochrome b561